MSHPSFVRLDGDCRAIVFLPDAFWLALETDGCIRFVSFDFFSMYHAVCVGQAKNPGPKQHSIQLVITNPTAVFVKLDALRNFGADVFFCFGN